MHYALHFLMAAFCVEARSNQVKIGFPVAGYRLLLILHFLSSKGPTGLKRRARDELIEENMRSSGYEPVDSS